MATYLSVEEAIPLRGLRLVLTRGVPGPWGEAAKALFHVKGVPFVRVAQEAGGENAALVRWTGAPNAPTAVWNDEPAVTDRTELIALAERIAPSPPLLPVDPAERADCFALIEAIAGENGFAWCRRLMIFESMMRAPSLPEPARRTRETLAARYGWSEEAAARAPERCAEVLRLVARRLHAQRARGRSYLVGESLTAADLYWATFAAMARPLPPELCPMPAPVRASYEVHHPAVDPALDPILFEHRDMVYQRHLELPVDT
jgi:glutathione S-transferase